MHAIIITKHTQSSLSLYQVQTFLSGVDSYEGIVVSVEHFVIRSTVRLMTCSVLTVVQLQVALQQLHLPEQVQLDQ